MGNIFGALPQTPPKIFKENKWVTFVRCSVVQQKRSKTLKKKGELVSFLLQGF
jgi:hypothetical protein